MDRLRIIFATLAFVSVGFIFSNSPAFSQAQLISDMTDYSPGETAILTGSGFSADEPVTLQVLHADGTPSSGEDHDPWIVVADSLGNFVATWHV